MGRKAGHLVLLAVFFSIINAFSGPGELRADVLLNVPKKTQEQTNWCWAGSSQAVLEYYGTIVSQCTIADWVRQNNSWGSDNCCFNPSGSICNQPNYMYYYSGSLQYILIHWSVNNYPVDSYLSQSTIVAEINNRRPFIMRFAWTSGGGHFLVGRGYDQGGLYVDYMDPWYGNGYTKSLYSWVVQSSNHYWTDTLQFTTSPAILPTTTTNSASKITGRSAQLKGTVNPNGSSTTYYFQWGTTTAYGNTTPSQSAGSGTSDIAVSANLSGLAPHTYYHYRLVASNSGGTSYGTDMTFSTKNVLPFLELLLN
jgi:hypothetical protein